MKKERIEERGRALIVCHVFTDVDSVKKEKARNLIIFDKCISRLIIKILDVIFILDSIFFF